MNNSAPKGTFDILPENPKDKWKNSDKWIYLESIIRELAQNYNFQEIRTPLFEKTELFTRGIGETSDIVSKEMYTFPDKANRSMTLRPEGTASVMRALIENKLYNQRPLNKLYYIGPMFRYERQQAGRYRQHHQFGIEAIGCTSPEQDAEVIDVAYSLCRRLGIKNLKLLINSLGDINCRKNYKTALINYLKPHLQKLSQDSQFRFEKNPLRILDSKNQKDIEIVRNAPSILEFLSPSCKEHFDSVCVLLKKINIPVKITPTLVRGLDYYNRTVFEIVTEDLGAQNSIAAGGRYDGLTKMLGGPDLPATGFATGLERLLLTMIKQKCDFPITTGPTIFFIPLGDDAHKECFSILKKLRSYNVSSEMDFSGKKLKNAMRYANDILAKYVAVVGESELEQNQINLKEMSSGNILEVNLSNFLDIAKTL